MGTCHKEMPFALTKSCPISLICVWEPFTNWQSVLMKLRGIWWPWNQIMPWKDRDSDGIFKRIPSVSCCTALGEERLHLGPKICGIQAGGLTVPKWGKGYANHESDPKHFRIHVIDQMVWTWGSGEFRIRQRSGIGRLGSMELGNDLGGMN